jgi:chemotaxis response regulator CheB
MVEQAPAKHISTLVVEDYPVFREALATIIESRPDMRLVAQAITAQEASTPFGATVPTSR